MTPLEIIAKKMIRRSSEDGEHSCGHRLGESDANAILMALDSAGYEIVRKPSGDRTAVPASPPSPETNLTDSAR